MADRDQWRRARHESTSYGAPDTGGPPRHAAAPEGSPWADLAQASLPGGAGVWTEERRERSDRSDEGRRRPTSPRAARAERAPRTQRLARYGGLPAPEPRTRPAWGRRRLDASPWHWLLFVPVIVPLVPGLYNRMEPTLGGVPFYYWGQLAFALLASGVLTLVHLATKSR